VRFRRRVLVSSLILLTFLALHWLLLGGAPLPLPGDLVPSGGRLWVVDLRPGVIPALDEAIRAGLEELPRLAELEGISFPAARLLPRVLRGSGPWRVAHWRDEAGGWIWMLGAEGSARPRRWLLPRLVDRVGTAGDRASVGVVGGVLVLASSESLLQGVRSGLGDARRVPVGREAIVVGVDSEGEAGAATWWVYPEGSSVFIEEKRTGGPPAMLPGGRPIEGPREGNGESLSGLFSGPLDGLGIDLEGREVTAEGTTRSRVVGLREALDEWSRSLRRFQG
jgi:hypothetical protein